MIASLLRTPTAGVHAHLYKNFPHTHARPPARPLTLRLCAGGKRVWTLHLSQLRAVCVRSPSLVPDLRQSHAVQVRIINIATAAVHRADKRAGEERIWTPRFLPGHHVLVYGLRTPTELLVRFVRPGC